MVVVTYGCQRLVVEVEPLQRYLVVNHRQERENVPEIIRTALHSQAGRYR